MQTCSSCKGNFCALTLLYMCAQHIPERHECSTLRHQACCAFISPSTTGLNKGNFLICYCLERFFGSFERHGFYCGHQGKSLQTDRKCQCCMVLHLGFSPTRRGLVLHPYPTCIPRAGPHCLDCNCKCCKLAPMGSAFSLRGLDLLLTLCPAHTWRQRCNTCKVVLATSGGSWPLLRRCRQPQRHRAPCILAVPSPTISNWYFASALLQEGASMAPANDTHTAAQQMPSARCNSGDHANLRPRWCNMRYLQRKCTGILHCPPEPLVSVTLPLSIFFTRIPQRLDTSPAVTFSPYSICTCIKASHNPLLGRRGIAPWSATATVNPVEPAQKQAGPPPTSHKDSVVLAVVNPTSVLHKEPELMSLGANIIVMSETSAVLRAQQIVSGKLRKSSHKVHWEHPAPSHQHRSQQQESMRRLACGVAIISTCLPSFSPRPPPDPELLSTCRSVCKNWSPHYPCHCPLWQAYLCT